MTLHSTKSLSFKGDNGDIFKIKHLAITPNAPEWIKKTQTFKDAIEDGCLVVLDNKEKKIAAENGDLAKKSTKKTAVE
jgi:hypothetical protein